MMSLSNLQKSSIPDIVAIHFISDLHLDPRQPSVVDGFLHYLKTRGQNAQTLYILGDFFEAWIGDDFSNPFTESVIAGLKTYTSRNIPVFFMHGNRDFLIGERFLEQTGCQLLTDPTVIDLFGRKALLMHGDTLCTDDVEYQNFRKTVRDPIWQHDFLAKPLEVRLSIAQNLREISKEKTHEKQYEIMDVAQTEVERVMADYNVDLLIHGHTHRPNRHELVIAGRPAERYVLGDWGENGWHLVCDREHGLLLTSFPIK